ncbi:MAG TPA: class I SAM-dependent methyltransferase, partial [Saprospiraceae bacterium]|nr:class I SAM-dependent methyltransferase [Saprospiraceae bacterium]
MSEDDLDRLSILADSAISRSKFANSLNADMIFDHLVNGVRNSRRRLEGAYPFLPIPLSEMSVLDIGCGSGAASVAIQSAGAKQVTSFDLNRDPLGIDFALSRRNVHGVPRDLLLANGYQLPFGRCSFDLAWCEYVVEHVSELDKLLSEAIRVLKPNGLMYIVTNNAWWPREPHSGLWWASWMPRKVAAR